MTLEDRDQRAIAAPRWRPSAPGRRGPRRGPPAPGPADQAGGEPGAPGRAGGDPGRDQRGGEPHHRRAGDLRLRRRPRGRRAGVSAYPSSVTAQMVYNFVRGGRAINVLAARARARIVVADVGVDHDFPPGLPIAHAKIGRGTADMTLGPAMSRAAAARAVATGIALAGRHAPAAGAGLPRGDGRDGDRQHHRPPAPSWPAPHRGPGAGRHRAGHGDRRLHLGAQGLRDRACPGPQPAPPRGPPGRAEQGGGLRDRGPGGGDPGRRPAPGVVLDGFISGPALLAAPPCAGRCAATSSPPTPASRSGTA